MKVVVPPNSQYTKRNYETASWWTKYDLQPGEYEVINGFTPKRSYGWGFQVPGVIVEDNFPSSFGYGTTLPYDRNKNTGKEVIVWHPFPDDYLHDDEEAIARWEKHTGLEVIK
jgi:hypothetical protein